MRSVLNVALTQILGSESGEKLPSQQEFDHVNLIIKGMSNLEMIESISTSIDNEEELAYFEEDCPAGWVDWSTGIYNTASDIALRCTDGEIFNACCNLDVAYKIKQLMHYCSIWTGVMSSTFGVDSKIATSSSVESESANLKKRVFKTELPLRAGKFVLRHITYLDGRVEEAATRNVGDQKSVVPSKTRNYRKKIDDQVKEQPVLENQKGNFDISGHIDSWSAHDIINYDDSSYCLDKNSDNTMLDNEASIGITEVENYRIEVTSSKSDYQVTCMESPTEKLKISYEFGVEKIMIAQ